MLKIDVITIFPEMFKAVTGESIIKRACRKKKIRIEIYNLRDFTDNTHRKVDERPFGGGPGMLISPEPVFKAVKKIKGRRKKTKVILLTPQGVKFEQKTARRLSKETHLIFICPRYEGIDERVRLKLVDEEISIGDYVLTGGELPALVVIDAVTRLIPGVLGDSESAISDSFENNLLEHPQYTRPANFRGLKVPEILLSGNHRLIKEWKRKQSLLRTKRKRPDLLKKERDNHEQS
ncbi:MAG: tRNA (guanosine(37)-N1)-methyltransferase TrmD [Candidatus Omnitrophica bacterium]|nr:tRNA (guanosine(37)-N1)-methyltransferase TrmD [Candidatus Omnitrophota bacterium]